MPDKVERESVIKIVSHGVLLFSMRVAMSQYIFSVLITKKGTKLGENITKKQSTSQKSLGLGHTNKASTCFLCPLPNIYCIIFAYKDLSLIFFPPQISVQSVSDTEK